MDGAPDNDEPFIFRLNDNGFGPSLLVKVCAERGWRMYQGYNGSEDKWNLWWRTGAFPAACFKTLGDWQFMNHIPKGGSICRKDGLSRLLRCMRKVYGSIYDFSPPCYHLPLEYAKLVTEFSRLRRNEDGDTNVIWIHKPVAQSQGRGIFLFRSICEMRCGTSAVVQRYIERPLLIAGYKFDLRLYVCVPRYRPLTAYMYAEGLARFGTDKYTLTDIHNPYRHLTNSSLNKSGPRYAECKDRIGSGCKWTLKQVRRALVGRWGAAEWLVWQRIRALVTLTLLAQAAGTPPARNCFEFYGFDVLLDDSLKPWLIEVNLSPALGANCEADVTVKQPMLHELFDLLGLPMRHTGLSLLRGPSSQIHSYSSEDEGAKPRVQVPRAVTAGVRRGSRWRRRRPLPVHCVTLLPPVSDYTEIADKDNKELNSGVSFKTTSEGSIDHSDGQTPEVHYESTKSSFPSLATRWRYSLCYFTDTAALPTALPPLWNSNFTPPYDPSVLSSSGVSVTAENEDTCRNAGPTAATRRRIMSACTWGNGVRWDRAMGRVGHWVRIYPHVLPSDEQMPVEDARDSVAQVSKLLKAAREVVREGGRDPRAPRDASRDIAFEAALRKKLDCGSQFEVWLPPF